MMADEKKVDDTLTHHSSLPDKGKQREFWDYHTSNGTWKSILWLHKEFDGDLIRVRAQIPGIVEEGNRRGMDMVEFLKEFTDALGTNNDVGRVSTDSSDDPDQHEDEAESGEARTVSGEVGGAEEESTGGEE